jgi:lysophospholipase L1-like esterase
VPSSRSAVPTSRASEPSPRGLAGSAALLLGVKVALAPLLVAQALRTRRRALVLPEAAGAREGRVGDAVVDDGTAALRLLIAGDSSAAGVGVAEQGQAVAGHLVRELHRRLGRPIEWALRARTGLSTAGVLAMLRSEPARAADVAVVISGVNDVTGGIGARRALAHRAALADWLLGRGVRHVAFAPLPPMHAFPLLPEPLRRVLGAEARRHDAALAHWASGRAGVSHAGFALELDPAGMAADGFHPGEPVYRACGTALAAHVARAVPALGIPA